MNDSKYIVLIDDGHCRDGQIYCDLNNNKDENDDEDLWRDFNNQFCAGIITAPDEKTAIGYVSFDYAIKEEYLKAYKII